jgi:hypothetical protein
LPTPGGAPRSAPAAGPVSATATGQQVAKAHHHQYRQGQLADIDQKLASAERVRSTFMIWFFLRESIHLCLRHDAPP